MDKHEAGHLTGEIKTILKKVSRNLYLSVNVLPEPVRTYMGAGYLLCRVLDTVVDIPGVPAAEKLRILDLARGLEKPDNYSAFLERAGAIAPLAVSKGERELLLKLEKVLSVYSSFSPEDRELVSGLLHGVSLGMEMDVRAFPGGEPAAFGSARDLELYCGRIGGAPGIFWARIYREAIRRTNRKASDFPSEADAEMIGSALQMTNVVKDIAADLRLGRCYIPQEDLDSKNMKPADLLLPSNMERLRDITGKWMYWALDRLDKSEAFISAIPKSDMALRAAAIWPIYWAMDTLEDAAHSNLLDPADRPRVTRNRIYATIAATPPLLLSNTAFARGYRFRRETLIGSILAGNYNGRGNE